MIQAYWYEYMKGPRSAHGPSLYVFLSGENIPSNKCLGLEVCFTPMPTCIPN